MSHPPIDPKKSAAGIALDPITLDRVIPESRRPDGTYVFSHSASPSVVALPTLTFFSSVRKQLKIRPGFTPQEDVSRFRGTKQAQLDANALPKGHIIGWAPPPTGKNGTTVKAASNATSSSGSGNAGGASSASDTTPMSKAAKKNAKRKGKREKDKKDIVPDDWEDDDEDEGNKAISEKSSKSDNASQFTSSTMSEDTLSGNLEKLQLS